MRQCIAEGHTAEDCGEMSERETWNDLRERRMESPAAAAGY
jgi:hypothetical protein